MLVLHPELRKLATMALYIGRFQWTGLPMGSIIATRWIPEEIGCHLP